MAEWKKIVVSGSNISELNNDAGYVTSIGSSIASASHVADGVKSGSINGDTLSLHQMGGGRIDVAMGGITPTTADTASYVNASKVDGTVATATSAGSATSASHAETADAVPFSGVSGKPTLVSGSAQINLGSATGTAANATAASTATSASHAVKADSADAVAYSGISGKPALVSGSAQISLASATGKAATAGTADTASYVDASNIDGDIAASSVAYSNITGKPTLVSGSAQISLASATGTAANATSASHAETADAVPFSGISSKPALVSGSAQIALGSATGTAANATLAATANALSTNATGTNLTLSGDLVINGSTTTVSTTNLEVEDRFVFLNDGGGGTTTEGGIIVESGTADSGNAFFYDSGTSRWAFAEGVSKTATSTSPLGFMGQVYVGTTAEADDSTVQEAGTIVIDNGNIFIRDAS